jgi:hypothetical protein
MCCCLARLTCEHGMSEHAGASSLWVPPLDAAHEYAVQCISMLVGDALNSADSDVRLRGGSRVVADRAPQGWPWDLTDH